MGFLVKSIRNFFREKSWGLGPQSASGSPIYNYYAFLYYVVNDEVLLNSSQTIQQIEVIQEVFVPGVS